MGKDEAIKTAFLEIYGALKELVDATSEESPEYLYAKNKLTQYQNFLGMGNGVKTFLDDMFPIEGRVVFVECPRCGKLIDVSNGLSIEAATGHIYHAECAGVKSDAGR